MVMSRVHIPRSGNALIDDGHQRIMNQLVEIGGLSRLPDRRSEAVILFRAFVTTLRNHLGLEEIILRANGYAQLDSHARRHTAMIDTIADMVETLTYAPKAQPMEVLEKISDLLFEHELVEDSDIWPCLTSDGTHILTEWNRKMETGIDRLDEHHKAMIGHLARFRATPDSAPREDIAVQLDSLAELTVLHFKLEEGLWSTQPDESKRNHDHARDHAQLLDNLGVMALRLLNGEIALSTFVDDFLTGWLNDHIVNSDIPHFRSLASVAPALRPAPGR